VTADPYVKDGDEIYRRSFSTIRAEADLARVPPDLEAAAVRMVHACGMVDLVEDLQWSPGAGTVIRTALREGATIFTDSMMLADGITRRRLPADNEVVCTLRTDGIVALAAANGTTRSAAAVDLWGERMAGSVVAIGNAPLRCSGCSSCSTTDGNLRPRSSECLSASSARRSRRSSSRPRATTWPG